MYTTINEFEFRDAFANMGRKEQFSYEALNALFQYYEECFPDSELDVIGICCEWSEYDTVAELRENYSQVLDDVEDEDVLEALQRETTVLAVRNPTSLQQTLNGEWNPRRFVVQEY
jgi:hypothetical protein